MSEPCRKCGGKMKFGVALGQTLVALRPSRGPNDMRTYYAGGTGKIIRCMKCEQCGWSVTAAESRAKEDAK